MFLNNNAPATGRKMTVLFFLFIISAGLAHAQTGNAPSLSAANTTNSDRAVLINSNYDGTAASANEFIYFRSGAANRNAGYDSTWFKKSQLVVADTMVAAYRLSGSGGVFKISNRGGDATERWWLGFGIKNDMSDGSDVARIGTQLAGTGQGSLFFSTGGPAGGGSQAERMRITSLGRVGIGTSSPAYMLDVNGSARVSSLQTNSVLIPSGNLGIGTLVPDYPLDVVGTARAGTLLSNSLEVNGSAKVSKFIVGAGPDLSIIADGGKQSVISSWNALQLVGNRSAAMDYSPENIGGLNDASVIIPNQQAGKIGLLVQGKASQTGNLLELRNSAGTKLTSFQADGRLCISCGPAITTSSALLELGQDSPAVTNQLLRVHGGATFNNELAPDELTQVSINTNFRVDSAALTVAGPAYIGSWQTAQSNPKKSYLQKYMLWVEKGIVTEDVAYAPRADWADYVFSNDYELTPLSGLKAYIQQHQHLPGVKSAAEVAANGYTNHEFNKTILAKVEELTLYIIDQDKQIARLRQELVTLKK